MTTDTIKHLGAEFHRAADSLADTLARLDMARTARLAFLRECSKDSAARLAALKEEIRTLPEQIAKWDAEAARLESQTAEDLLRQALGAVVLHPQPPGEVSEPPLTQPAPEPYRAGLPPERLRKVWAEWEMEDHGIVTFIKGNRYRWKHWMADDSKHISETAFPWDREAKIRPHGATWARVETMADEAEKPTLLDLTKLPPGTVCEAEGIIEILGTARTIEAGKRLCLVRISEGSGYVTASIDSETWAFPALVPARVVKEGGEQ